jgi:hypothetical protein
MISRPSNIDWSQPVNWDSPLNRGLVSWWLAGENPYWGGARFLDLCQRNPGTLTGGPTWQGGKGRPGSCGAIDLDGANDYVAVPASASTTGLNTDWTAIVALRLDTIPNIYGILSHAIDDTAGWTIVRNFGIGDNFAVYDGAGYRSSGYALVAGVDYYIGVTASGTTLTFFVRAPGVNHSATATYTSRTDANAGFAIGRFWSNVDAFYLDGQIFEVAMLNRAILQSEFETRYQDSLCGYPDTLARYSPRRFFFRPTACRSPAHRRKAARAMPVAAVPPVLHPLRRPLPLPVLRARPAA